LHVKKDCEVDLFVDLNVIKMMSGKDEKSQSGIRSTRKSKTCKLQYGFDKTFIGRIQKGFDFLGYQLNGLILKPAVVTIERAIAKITLLYEENTTPVGGRVADYARRWNSWVRASVPLSPGSLMKYHLPGASLVSETTYI
jgi:hypothetical protein